MQAVLHRIHETIRGNPGLEESEVTSVFENEDFFETLGYEGIPVDVRSEKHIVGGDRPDYFCKDEHGNTVFVVEFKRPSRDVDLASHKPQLLDQYVEPTRADFGVLTDGTELILYEWDPRAGEKRLFRSTLDSVTGEQVSQLQRLEKPTFRARSKESLDNRFDEMDQVAVSETVRGVRVGQRDFLDTFRLEQGTLFYEMLENVFDLLVHYTEGEELSFPEEAFDFWQKYYASSPGWYDLPKEWRDIAGSAANKPEILFCVETVQSLLGRLVLAKACEDNNFPGVRLSRFVRENTSEFRGEVQPVSFVQTAEALLEKLRSELVESVFEQDIYYWWTEPAERAAEMSRREVAETDWADEVEAVGESFADLFLAISRYDFSEVRGDPLGELYQRYFDSETRRRLGEFYTPPSLVEYAVDAVEFERSESTRLLDPACGSGTFLVEAIKKHKTEIDRDEVYWPDELRRMTERGGFIGLDIHPFAVVLAQIRVMVEILPEYRDAIDEDPTMVLKRLPIFRTDSLYNESVGQERGQGQQRLTTNHEKNLFEFETELPVKSDDEFVTMQFSFPQFSRVRKKTANEIDRRQDYFVCMQAVFDVVKQQTANDQTSPDTELLSEQFGDYFGDDVTVEMAVSPFEETASNLLDTFDELQEEYDDGRLVKLVEDLVLGALVKNSLKYDYVVGNPPWVDKQTKTRETDDRQEMQMKQQFVTAWGETDPYMQFTERALGMLREGGRLGFVIPNRVFKNEGARSLRGLLAKNRIHEIVDFTDYQLFEDATNYTTFLDVEKRVPNDDWRSFLDGNEFTDDYAVPVTRVRDWDGTNADLMEQVASGEPTDTVDVFDIPIQRFQSRVQTKGEAVACTTTADSFEIGGREIDLERGIPVVDVWPIAPPREYDILDDIENAMEMRLGDRTVVRDNDVERRGNLVGNEIREGIATSGDGAYVVNPTIDIDPESFADLPVVSVEPSSLNKEFTVETGLLKADVTGGDVDRWLPKWDNRLVFVPYEISDDDSRLLRPTEVESTYPKTWHYFTDPEILQLLSDESGERAELHRELAVKLNVTDPDPDELSKKEFRELSESLRSNPEKLEQFDEDFWWYRYMYKKRLQTLPKPKVMAGDLVQYNKLCFDDGGIMAPHNASVYAIMLDSENKRAVAGVLNSAAVEFYHKQTSRVHQGKAYRYIKDHTSKWPVVIPEGDGRNTIEDAVGDILHLKDLQIKTSEFPDPYIAQARETGAEFETIEVTPEDDDADPTVQRTVDGGHRIVLGEVELTREIDSEAHAEFVCESLRAAEPEAGETVSIPVPHGENVAQDALDEFAGDIGTLDESSIEELEARIDSAVFDAYGIDEEDRELIRRYNRQYESTGPLN